MTTAPMVAFTDDDAVPDADWLRVLVAALARAAPTVGGVGGRVIATRRGLIADYMTRHRILEPPGSRKYLVTVNCIYRREAILAAGGFDERLRAAGGEDPGLAMKIREAGGRSTTSREPSLRITSERAFATSRSRSSATGEDADVSWVDELRPGSLTPRRLLDDVVTTWRGARAEGDGRRRSLAHVGLKLLQTLTYAAGWASGARGADQAATPASSREEAARAR
jgi:hypothetical protein